MAWRIFAVLSAAYLSSQFFRVSNAVIAPELMRELGLSPSVLGAMTGAFFFTFALAQIPGGILLDRWGPRRTMPSIMLAAVAGSLLFAAAQATATLILARALLGAGCAVGLMGALVLLGRWFPAERFAPLSALLFAIGGSGTLLATTPLAAITAAVGWRAAFVGMAAVTAGLAALIFLVARDRPNAAPASQPVLQPAAPPAGDILSGLRDVLRNRPLRRIAALQFVGYGSLMSIAGLWAGPYLEDVHALDPVGRGNVLLAVNLAIIAGALGYGWLAPRVRSPKRLVVPGTACGIALFACLALLEAPPLWIAAPLLVLAALFASYFMLLHAHARAVLAPEVMGRGLTVQNSASIFGVFVWQSLTGLIVDAFALPGGPAPEIAYRTVFGFLGVVSLAGLLVYTGVEEGAPDAR